MTSRCWEGPYLHSKGTVPFSPRTLMSAGQHRLAAKIGTLPRVDPKPFPRAVSMSVLLLCLLAMLSNQNRDIASASVQDPIRQERESAAISAMHAIAVIQAESGDIDGAKITANQITEDDSDKAPSEVTVVSFCEGCTLYDHLPGTMQRLNSVQYELLSPDRQESSNVVPKQIPPGLPANYLAPDPEHGAVVDFLDTRDPNGKRVTSRRYEDGSFILETP
jgi:hypothetical protein